MEKQNTSGWRLGPLNFYYIGGRKTFWICLGVPARDSTQRLKVLLRFFCIKQLHDSVASFQIVLLYIRKVLLSDIGTP